MPNGIPYALGLDIGASSIGWAAIKLDPKDQKKPVGLLGLGVRIFPAGVEGSEKDIEQGKDESRGVKRRLARQVRRQLARRAQRLRRLFRLLQRIDLLPKEPSETPDERNQLLQRLDERLRDKWITAGDHRGQQILPYRLRAAAVDRPLERHELGRALYHLAQRRGYLSNRLAPESDDEEKGKVLAGISELAEALQGRTLGQYFSSPDIDPEAKRIRQRWTARQMYLDEFDRIWTQQAQVHADLANEDVRGQVRKAIFFQRKLKSAKHLIGKCELVRTERRCPVATLVAQECRILQAINHIQIHLPDGEIRPLSADERQTLIDRLSRQAEMTFAKAKTLLKLPKGTKFNLEEGGETRLVGNRTVAKITSDLPGVDAWWSGLTPERRDAFVKEMIHYQKPEAFAKRLVSHWGVPESEAGTLSQRQLELAYASHSEIALRKLLPLLMEGEPYTRAKLEAFPESLAATEALDELPTLDDDRCKELRSNLRNPAVVRALAEMRKVVNAAIRKWGKPERVSVEMARELRKNRKDRAKAAKNMRDQEQRRLGAGARLLENMKIQNPPRWMIEKVLLADECGWLCPFTGKTIGWDALVGPNPQFDIEHIYPRRYLDDSFMNKTLCHHECNRNEKKDRLPSSAFSGHEDRWREILTRVKAFRGPFAEIKLQRFQMKPQDIPENFASRQLNDTKYSSRLARDYLAMLYGGKWDQGGELRVVANTGGVTAFLRRVHGLNRILGDDGEKNRADHRHHAIDAVAVALSSPSVVKQLADATANAKFGRMFSQVDLPWERFDQTLKSAIDQCIVSHRADHRLAGPLHAESNYSRAIATPNGKEIRIRKPLVRMSKVEVGKIADDRVRTLVQNALDNGEPAKVFADQNNLPYFTSKDGRRIVIRKARITVNEKPTSVAGGSRIRYVASGAGTNHHAVIVAKLDANGVEEKWVMHVVTRLEAYRRKRTKQPVVQKDFGLGWRFKFSLMPDDCLEVQSNADGDREIFRIASLSAGEIQMWEHWRAKPEKKDRSSWNRITNVDVLRVREARKICVLPLGSTEVFGTGMPSASTG